MQSKPRHPGFTLLVLTDQDLITSFFVPNLVVNSELTFPNLFRWSPQYTLARCIGVVNRGLKAASTDNYQRIISKE